MIDFLYLYKKKEKENFWISKNTHTHTHTHKHCYFYFSKSCIKLLIRFGLPAFNARIESWELKKQ